MRFPVMVLLAFLATPAWSGEFIAYGRVVQVTPVTRSHEITQRAAACFGSPPAGHSLSEAIAWDLGLGGCMERVRHDTVTGYRVTYEWNGRQYTHVTSSQPKDYMRLRVQVN